MVKTKASNLCEFLGYTEIYFMIQQKLIYQFLESICG